MKKLFSLILAVLMLAGMFAACGKTENPTPDASAPTADDAAAPAEEADGEEAAAPAEETPAVEEKPAEEPAPAPAPAEPEPEPEPEKAPEYDLVWELNFAEMADSEETPFDAKNHIENLRIEDGALKGTSIGGDPFMHYNGEFNLPAETVDYILIKELNETTAYDGQFFFTTETASWSEPASVKYMMYYNIDDGDDNRINEIELYPEESVEWVGTVTGFRIDPTVTDGDFAITYIGFYKEK